MLSCINAKCSCVARLVPFPQQLYSRERYHPLFSAHQPVNTISGRPLYDTIHPLCDKVADQSKRQQPAGQRPEPRQAVHILSRDQDVHAPHARDDVHGQHNGPDDSELTQDVIGLFRALVHANVDLREVVAVSSREQAARGGISKAQELKEGGRTYFS